MKIFKLENEPKIKPGFNAPDNYFDDFSTKIMQQLPKKEAKVLSIFQKKKFILMLVAAVLVIGLFIPIPNTSSGKSKELDSTALENYLTDQSNINQYDLVNELDSVDINKMQQSVALEDETIEDILSYNSNAENLIME